MTAGSKDRFIRLKQLLGAEQIAFLSRTHVAVFGLGAVGSYACEALARSAVGRFTLVDFDRIQYSNFNRQLLALESTVGKPKAVLAAQRIQDINPRCRVEACRDFSSQENFAAILSSKPDIVIDAIDSLNPKTELISYCVKQNVSFISSMGAGNRTDPFSVSVGDIADAHACPLAQRLRKRLKKQGITGGVRCIYSKQAPVRQFAAVDADEKEYERGRKRAPVGTIAYMPAIFGFVLAYEVIMMVLHPNVSRGKEMFCR